MIESDDKRRVPAQVVPHWRNERRTSATEVQLAAFGYDMDNMKCRTWIEREIPLWRSFSRETRRDLLDLFIRQTTKGADQTSFFLTRAIKSALHDRPKDARGDSGFIAERFFRETEVPFYQALGEAQGWIERAEDGEEDPTPEYRCEDSSLVSQMCFSSAAIGRESGHLGPESVRFGRVGWHSARAPQRPRFGR